MGRHGGRPYVQGVSIQSALVHWARSFRSVINGDATKHKALLHGCPEGVPSSGRGPGRGVDSYRVRSEIFLFVF